MGEEAVQPRAYHSVLTASNTSSGAQNTITTPFYVVILALKSRESRQSRYQRLFSKLVDFKSESLRLCVLEK